MRATDDEITDFLKRLLSALPAPRGTELTQLATSYRFTIADYSNEVLDAFLRRLLKGEIEGITRWLPYPPELGIALKKLDTEMNRPMSYGQYRLPEPNPVPPFIRNREKKLAENADCELLFDDVDFDRWRHLSKTRQVPVGARWVAALGRVYGPHPGKVEKPTVHPAAAKFKSLLESAQQTADRIAQEKESAEIRARYGITPQSVSSIPDAKDYWKRGTGNANDGANRG